MIPIQQRTGNDCYRACIASVLELPYEDVPIAVSEGDDSVIQNNTANLFIRSLGFALCIFSIWGTKRPYLMYGGEKINYLFSPPCHWILSARSPRNDDNHCVVMYGTKIVWDPHPQRDMGVGEFEIAHIIAKL